MGDKMFSRYVAVPFMASQLIPLSRIDDQRQSCWV